MFDASYDMSKAAKFAADCRCNTTVDGVNLAQESIAKGEAISRSRNEMYIAARRDGKTADEAMEIVKSHLAASGLRLVLSDFPIYDDDEFFNGDIDELTRMYL